MKKVIVSVINDLSTDQRVHKVCTTLKGMGYEVTLVGRKQRKSMPLEPRAYPVRRMSLLFEKGPLFYAEFQFRLFLYLLFHRADVLVSNDLDTLWPNYRISKMRGTTLVYDTHELFCEVPELQGNPGKRNAWKRLEASIFPKLKHVFTVNDSIARIYSEEYGVPVKVVRNMPRLAVFRAVKTAGREELGMPGDKRILVMQGAGINIQRGAEEAVQAMKYVDNAVLYIIGGGDVIGVLKDMIKEMKLDDKVKFTEKMPFEKLIQYTRNADLGLTLDKDTNPNYRYSLPNKLFDYIHAGVPVLSSSLVEIKKVLDDYQVGTTISSHDPKHIAERINEILGDETTLQEWKKNTKIAAGKLNWEAEEQRLKDVYQQFL